jgi:hypothetical protein
MTTMHKMMIELARSDIINATNFWHWIIINSIIHWNSLRLIHIVTGRLNIGVGELMGEVVARQTRFQFLNNMMQQSDVVWLVDTVVVGMDGLVNSMHQWRERCFPFGSPRVYIWKAIRAPETCSRFTTNETSAPAKQGLPHHWQISKEHFNSWYAYILSNSICIQLYNQIM